MKTKECSAGIFYFRILLAAAVLLLPLAAAAQSSGDDEDYLSPVRPTVSESASIQKKGVVQIEYGGDFDFDSPDYKNEQSGQLGLYYAAAERLRLDLELDTFVSQRDRMGMRQSGIGDVNLGFKVIARDQPKKRLGVAFSYSVKLPAASADQGLGTGKIDHHLRLILDRTYGKNDFVFNASYLNVGREESGKRASGAQMVLTYERELTKKFSLVGEAFGNSVDEQQPRGLYLNGALEYKINKHCQLDAGIRPGFGQDAPRIGIFAGIVVGIGK